MLRDSPGGHAALADPSFSPPPLLSLFSKSKQQHRPLIHFLLPPAPLLMSPPPLLSAALFPLRATFLLLVIFRSLLCLPLLNISALASQELKSRLLASKPITHTVCHLYIFGSAPLFWSLLATLWDFSHFFLGLHLFQHLKGDRHPRVGELSYKDQTSDMAGDWLMDPGVKGRKVGHCV